MSNNQVSSRIHQSSQRGWGWLAKQHSVGGGWGDERHRPMPGVTGHVLLCYADLGIIDPLLFGDDLEFLVQECKEDEAVFGMYWADNRLTIYSEKFTTYLTSLLGALPLLIYRHHAGIALVNMKRLEDSVVRWGWDLCDTRLRSPSSVGMWELYMLARALHVMSYEGSLWGRLRESIVDTRSDNIGWRHRGAEASKESAHALSALMHLPSVNKHELVPVVDYLFDQVNEAEEFACWESLSNDRMRGPYFATRWVLRTLLEANASQLVTFRPDQMQKLEKAADWLAWIQRPDGAWADELQGDPFSEDKSRCDRSAGGAAFIAYAVLALAKWLLANGYSSQNIRDDIENSFSSASVDGPSVFISYGGPDELFADRLNLVLRKRGIKTFFFLLHAIPGQKLHRLMREGVNTHDRVILVCSKSSLDRQGVLNELEETLQREAREGGKSILIPIKLDDYVLEDWAPDRPGLAQAVRDRVVADFSGAWENQQKFGAAVERLIEGLQTPS